MRIYTEKPQDHETVRTFKGWLTTFHLEPRELTEEERREHEIPETWTDEQGKEQPQEAWCATDVLFYHEQPHITEENYAELVATIVRRKFSADAVEAITQNYLETPDRDDYRRELRELQKWRVMAKRVAKAQSGRAETKGVDE
ncbi:MAG: hypothetical protein J5971_00950 [Prevotella sp.]|nr:hypothetical protein [Prevotella sp.]